MIRDDIGGCWEPPRPRRKRSPWVPLVLLVVAGLVAVHMLGLTGPLAGLAGQLGLGHSRSMHTPSDRLVGDWTSDDDPMFQRVSHAGHKKESGGTGLYMGDGGYGMNAVIYHVESEDRFGTDLVMVEFLPRQKLNGRVTYAIAKDGQSMTREYMRDGKHLCCHYRYLGPPTEEIPTTKETRPPF